MAANPMLVAALRRALSKTVGEGEIVHAPTYINALAQDLAQELEHDDVETGSVLPRLFHFAQWLVDQKFIDSTEYMLAHDLFALNDAELPAYLVEGFLRHEKAHEDPS